MHNRIPELRRRKSLAGTAFFLAVMGGVLASSLSAGPIIGFTFTSLGLSSGRYTYSFSGLNLLANQEVDIAFDQTVYGVLSNGLATSDFHLVLLQPNNPPGVPGDYSALATINNPSVNGTFSVDVTFLGATQPTSQPFTINQFDSGGHFISTIASGSTTPVPEPTSSLLIGSGAGLIGILFVGRSRAQRRARNLPS
jgi:hypothetical protein